MSSDNRGPSQEFRERECPECGEDRKIEEMVVDSEAARTGVKYMDFECGHRLTNPDVVYNGDTLAHLRDLGVDMDVRDDEPLRGGI